MHRTRQSTYVDGSKPSFLLASQIHYNEGLAEISVIKNETGVILEDPCLINAEFQQFYKSLYTSNFNIKLHELEDFFHELNIPRLSPSEIEALEAPVTINEIYEALKSMNVENRRGGTKSLQRHTWLSGQKSDQQY